MSQESVQFTELVREKYAALVEQNLDGIRRWMFCEGCGRQQPHDLREEGLDEVYTCRVCGGSRWFRVR